jgi:hypothetical protein
VPYLRNSQNAPMMAAEQWTQRRDLQGRSDQPDDQRGE